MKYILLVSLALALWPTVAFAQAAADPELFPVAIDRKLGYIDVNGRVVIGLRFQMADMNGHFNEGQHFKEGLAIAFENDRGGFIDKTGRFVIEGPYFPRAHFSNGLARVDDRSGKVGFVDKTGRLVIPPRFQRAEDFSEGLAVVQLQGKWGYVDETGRMVIPPRFDDADSFRDGFALVNIRSVKRGYIDRAGSFMPMPDEVEEFGTLAEGLVAVKVQNKWGFMNTLGRIVIAPQFDPDIDEYHEDRYYGVFKDGVAPVKSEGKWGYIDKAGRFSVPPKFDKAEPFTGGLAKVSLNKRWGLINRGGEFVAPPKYEAVGGFAEGMAVVSFDGKTYGFIDESGRVVIEPRFNEAVRFSEGLAAVKTAVRVGGKVDYLWGYIDKSGRFVIEPQFISAGIFYKGLARQNISEFWGIPAPSPGFHDEWGYIDRTGKYVWKSTDKITP